MLRALVFTRQDGLQRVQVGRIKTRHDVERCNDSRNKVFDETDTHPHLPVHAWGP